MTSDRTSRQLMCFFVFATAYGCQPTVTVPPNLIGTSNAIQVPLNCIVLIRAGGDTVALKLTKHTETGDGGTKYVYYHQDDGTADFSKSNVKSGSGEVYEQLATRITGLHTQESRDTGGLYFVNCGPFKIEWSNGDWLYLLPGHRMAITSWTHVNEIDINNIELDWKALQ